jgi:TolB protein
MMSKRHGNFASNAALGLTLFAASSFAALAGGCASHYHYSQVAPDDSAAPSAGADGQTPIAPPTASAEFASPDSIKPSNLNEFGEINGVEQTVAHAYGEAGFEQHTFLDEGYDSDVNIDPTGKWMVFTSTRHSEHPNIYLQRVDGLSVIQLTNDEADYAYPTFSPDGKQIAFSSTRGGNWDIYLMDQDGRDIVQITSDNMQHVHPSFSPDGTRLVYSALGSKSGQWELWTADLNSGEKRMIGFGLFPSWSPAKGLDRIAFQRARERGSRWFSLWTLDLDNGEAKRVTEVAVSTNSAIVSPGWSPDGQLITFATIANPGTNADGKPQGQQDIWTINSDGTNRHRVTDGIGTNLAPCWAAGNQIYFISDRSGAECIWSAKCDVEQNTAKVADKPHGADSVGDANDAN